MPPVINLVDPAPTFSWTVRVPFATLLASDGRFLEGRLDMFLARSSMTVLVVIALGLSACAAIDVYPSPRPIDLSVGLDEGLITRDWDGGHPMRLLDRKSTRLNSSHGYISYAVFCLKKKKKKSNSTTALH